MRRLRLTCLNPNQLDFGPSPTQVSAEDKPRLSSVCVLKFIALSLFLLYQIITNPTSLA